MLEYSHDYLLVAASLAVALMAAFTGLSLTRGASAMPIPRRKLMVAMAAVALGGGIWSMHFVAMLGLQLPILYYYDALITLISALLAILITGISLLILHFGPRDRTRGRILAAGLVMGTGIPVMHYVGMSGMELCRPVYTGVGVVLAVLASVALSVAAVWIAYGQRLARNIILGTVCFGLAVFLVHFLAMAGTGFLADEGAVPHGPILSNDVLAFGVTLAAFVISGAFLLTGVTFASAQDESAGGAGAGPSGPVRPDAPAAVPAPGAAPRGQSAHIPYEKDGRTRFIAPEAVAAIRAEGHYTFLYAGTERLFCPWSISETEKRLDPGLFLRTHRSYLVNKRLVSGFERKKDTGVCLFEGVAALARVPVSRSRLLDVRQQLGV